jgi:hypothetical protein
MPVVRPIQIKFNAAAVVLSLDGAEADKPAQFEDTRPFFLPARKWLVNIFGNQKG